MQGAGQVGGERRYRARIKRSREELDKKVGK